MDVESLDLPGLKLVRPQVHRDARGFFLEAYRVGAYAESGIDVQFIQDNHSMSEAGCLRGLHFQRAPGQAKLVRVVVGEIFDVAVDMRRQSATFGQWRAVTLSAENAHQLFVPAGFLHGFFVTRGPAEVLYKVSSLYDAREERQVRWDDPLLGILWPHRAPILSARDQAAPGFQEAMRALWPPGTAWPRGAVAAESGGA